MIVDDQYAVIGTANGARRSFDFDSEVAIGVFDRIPKDKTIASFARRLRMRLWSENLDGNTGQDFLNLADGRAAAFWWDAIATVGMGNASGQGWKLYTWEQYLSTASAGTPCADWEWDQIRDPIPPGPT
jgi:phosphatidylserine/phosphatidylglycerophosphate/cardiolipin synthase-like enzyme